VPVPIIPHMMLSPKDRPLRRKVAMAYRTAREAGKSHDRAFEAAMTVYLEARPEEKDRPGRPPLSGGSCFVVQLSAGQTIDSP
jgi:hypothetical protein